MYLKPDVVQQSEYDVQYSDSRYSDCSARALGSLSGRETTGGGRTHAERDSMY